MSNALDQLSKNLASGMSRRKALWQFVSGLGVVAAVLTGRKASAGNAEVCRHFCEAQAEDFKAMCLNEHLEFCAERAEEFRVWCLQDSERCGRDECALIDFHLGGRLGGPLGGRIQFNGGGCLPADWY